MNTALLEINQTSEKAERQFTGTVVGKNDAGKSFEIIATTNDRFVVIPQIVFGFIKRFEKSVARAVVALLEKNVPTVTSGFHTDTSFKRWQIVIDGNVDETIKNIAICSDLLVEERAPDPNLRYFKNKKWVADQGSTYIYLPTKYTVEDYELAESRFNTFAARIAESLPAAKTFLFRSWRKKPDNYEEKLGKDWARSYQILSRCSLLSFLQAGNLEFLYEDQKIVFEG